MPQRPLPLKFFKKKRLATSPLPNSVQLIIDNDKLSTTDTSDEEAETGTWLRVQTRRIRIRKGRVVEMLTKKI